MQRFQHYLPKGWPKPLTSFINGEFRVANSDNRFPILLAAANETIAYFEEASLEEVDRAIEGSKNAQLIWKQYTPVERSRVLRKISDLLKERNDEISILESLDTSRVISETIVEDVVSAKDAFEYYASIAHLEHGDHIQLSSTMFGYTMYEPLGVIAGIGAWNYPIQGMAWKVAPALAGGNGFVFKPSEHAVMSALALAEIIVEAGAPRGLVNVVLGNHVVGQQISTHRDISKVSFTGSYVTGAKISKAVAESDCETVLKIAEDSSNVPTSAAFKQLTMELGGKSPLIIFEDAHLDNAVAAALYANFYANGEICSNGTRVFVQRSIKEKFLKKFVEKAQGMKMGFPLDEEAQISSLVSVQQFEKVMNYISVGQEEGANLVIGGEAVESVAFDGEVYSGSFVLPTIFDECTDDMRIVREEIFGPVACILVFDEYDEVIKRANDTPFGLAGGVFTQDISKAHQAVKQIEAGIMYINNYNTAVAEMPWGGFKFSGKGTENGLHAIRQYTKSKTVYVEMGDIPYPY